MRGNLEKNVHFIDVVSAKAKKGISLNMKIDYTNKDIINEININNLIFQGFIYEEIERLLTIKLNDFGLSETLKIEFFNVLILNCNMYQPCKVDDEIIEFKISDSENLIKDIRKKLIENSYKSSVLDLEKNYIELEITLKSENKISIVCEYIEIK